MGIKSDYDVENEYTNIYKNARKLNSNMKNINTILKEHGYVEDSRGDMGESLLTVVIPEHGEKFPVEEVKGYIETAFQLARQFENFDTYHKENDYFEVSRLNAIKKAERIDQWRIWRDKLVRWTVGVSAAIFLYSLFVYLSGEIAFIKIPVRDLVLGGK